MWTKVTAPSLLPTIVCLYLTNSYFYLSLQMENCGKGRERELCTYSALGTHVMKQPPNPTEGPPVDEQADIEHEVQSNSVFCHGADSGGISHQQPPC